VVGEHHGAVVGIAGDAECAFVVESMVVRAQGDQVPAAVVAARSGGVDVDVDAVAVASGEVGDGVEGAFGDFTEGVDPGDVDVAVAEQLVACFASCVGDDQSCEFVAVDAESEASVVAEPEPDPIRRRWGVHSSMVA
jgi:hypothetical protein